MSAQEQAESTEAKAREVVGRVVSSKMDKTVTVLVERKVKHPLYKKYIRRSSKLLAHDETNEGQEGDTVAMVQCRPLSKSKTWSVTKVLTRAN